MESRRHHVVGNFTKQPLKHKQHQSTVLVQTITLNILSKIAIVIGERTIAAYLP